MDGLGRPMEVILKQGSLETGGIATDFVSATTYDEYGRERYKFLPFMANNTGGNTSLNDGAFKMNPFQQQAAFMAGQYGSQGETYFYSQLNFDNSPLNRVQESFAPGNSWVGTSSLQNESNRKSVKQKYWLNTATDAVRIWTASETFATGSFGSYSTSGIYAAGNLTKTVGVDEHGSQVIEFRDKEGKTILRKVQVTTAAGTADDGSGRDYTGWLCTYYIYDDFSSLKCVIQPKGVELLLANNWNINALNGDILNEQCFRYEYDQRNRMILKKVPGASEVRMVYDKLESAMAIYTI
jgi:hypothetical protein